MNEYACPACGRLVDPWVPVCLGPHPWINDRSAPRVPARIRIIRPDWEWYACVVCERRFRRGIGDGTITCRPRCHETLIRVARHAWEPGDSKAAAPTSAARAAS